MQTNCRISTLHHHTVSLFDPLNLDSFVMIFVNFRILFVSIYYYMVGMNKEFDRFLMTCLIVLLVTQVVVSFGYFISCIAPSLQVALALAPTLIIPFLIFGGFFLQNDSSPAWLSWLKWLSWFLYSNELLVINQWSGVTFDDCQNGTLIDNDNMIPCFQTGDAVISNLGFDQSESHKVFNLLMLVALTVGFRFCGFLALLLKTFRKSK